MKSTARFFVLTAAVALATTISFRDAKPAFVPQAHAQLAGACGFLTDGIQAAYKYCSENGLGFSACASELKNKGIEVMKAAWDGIKGVWEWLKGLPGQVEGWMGTLWDFIKSVSPVKAYDYAKAKVSEVAGWASDLATKAAGDLARNPKIKRVKSALSGVKSAFSNWSTFHPIDSANAIYNSFKELKDALYGAVSAAAGAAGSLASEALGKLNEIKAEIKAKVQAKIDDVKKQVNDKINTEVEAFKASAKSQALSLAKKVGGAIIKKVMSGSAGAPSERSVTQQLAAAIANELKPFVKKGVDAVAKMASTTLSAVFGGASVSVEAVCASVATAVGAATAGIGLAVAPICSCVAGALLTVFKNWLVDYISGKVIEPLIQKALEKIVDPIAGELLKGYEGDLRAWLSGLGASGAAAIKAKINSAAGALRDVLPAKVFELASAGADAGLESFGKAAPSCVGIGFFRGIDCLRKAAGDALKAAGNEIVTRLIKEFLEGPAASLKARYNAVRGKLVSALQELGVPLAGDIVTALESTGKDVAINFAKEAVGCVGRLIGSGTLKQRVGAAIGCVGTAAKNALKGGGDSLVRAAVKMLADNAASGARALGSALSAAVGKLAGEAADAIPAGVRTAIRDAAQKGLDDGAKKFASQLNGKCVSLQRKDGQTFGQYVKSMGGCVLGAAESALKAGAVGAVQSAIRSALASVQVAGKNVSSQITSLLGEYRDKAPTLVSGLQDAVKAATKEGLSTFKQQSQGCPAKFKSFGRESAQAVVSCVKDAAGKAFSAAGIGAVQSAIRSALASVQVAGKAVSSKINELLGQYRDKAPTLVSGLQDAVKAGTKEGLATFKQQSSGCPRKFTAFTREAAGAVVSCVKSAATTAFKAAGIGAVQSAIRSALASVQVAGKSVSSKINELLGQYRDKAPTLVSGLQDAVKAGTKEGLGTFKQLAAGCPAKFNAFSREAAGAVVSCVRNAATKAFAAAGVGAVQSALRSALSAVRAVGDKLQGGFESALSQFRSKAPGLISGLAGALAKGTKDGLAKFKQASAGCPGKFKDFTSGSISAVVSCVRDAASKAVTAAGVGAIKDALRRVVAAIGNGASSAVRSAVGAVNNGLKAVGVSIDATPLANAAEKKIAGARTAANSCISGFNALTKEAAMNLRNCLGRIAGLKGKCLATQEMVKEKCVVKCKTTEKRGTDGKCKAAPKCKTGETRGADGKCKAAAKCKTGETRGEDGKCKAAAKCKANEVKGPNGKCRVKAKCDAGKELVGTVCRAKCKTGQTRGPNNNCRTAQTDGKCKTGTVKVGTVCRTACKTGQTRGPNGNCRTEQKAGTCKTGTVKVGNVCRTACKTGQTRGPNGNCRAEQKVGTCKTGTVKVGNVCRTACKSNQTRGPNGTCRSKATCPAGTKASGDGLCRRNPTQTTPTKKSGGTTKKSTGTTKKSTGKKGK